MSLKAKLKILITNHSLTKGGGTQSVVFDMACAMRRKGHEIAIFSPQLGRIAQSLEDELFPVFSDPRDMEWIPDVIHGQHNLETMTAVLALPQVPTVFFQHGLLPWQETAPLHPRIVHYVCLSTSAKSRLTIDPGVPEERISVIPNGIDLSPYLEGKPVESLNKAAICARTHIRPDLLETILQICSARGIEVDHVTKWAEGSIADPASIYSKYDLIFGSGRTAIEAMASGCAVVTIGGHSQLGPMITSSNFQERRDVNFIMPVWEQTMDSELVEKQLQCFSATDHLQLIETIRKNCSVKNSANLAEEIYYHAIETALNMNFIPKDELVSTSTYLHSLSGLFFSLKDDICALHNEISYLQSKLADERNTAIKLKKKIKSHIQGQQEHQQTRTKLLFLQESLRHSTLLRILTRNIRKAIKKL